MKKLVCSVLILACSLTAGAQTYKVDVSSSAVKDLQMSDIAEAPQEVRLKIPAGIEISKFRNVFQTKDGKHLLVVYANYAPCLFDMEGNLVKSIDGLAPEKNQWTMFHFDRATDMLYVDNLDEWTGVHVFSGRVKQVRKPKEYPMAIRNFVQLSENEYLGYVNNKSGQGNTLFVVFDADGKVLYSEPNRRNYVKVNVDSPYQDGLFYEYDTRHYCMEPYYGTTVYEVDDKKITPHILFEMGSKTPSYVNQDLNRQNENIAKDEWKIATVSETEGRVYFHLKTKTSGYWGYYDKQTGQTQMASETSATAADRENGRVYQRFAQGGVSVMSEKDGDELKVVIAKLK